MRAVVLAALGALVLAGCVAPKEQSTPAPGGTAPAPEGGLDGYYEQDVDWEACGSLECAVVQAPLDWDAPGSGAIELAISRLPASGSPDDRVGSLLINPGGPGSSGITFLPAVEDAVGREIKESYDIVGFDPRGVAQSSSVDCGSDAQLDEYLLSESRVDTPEALEEARTRARDFFEACSAETGALLDEVDTVSAARDLDLLRAVLGDTALHYLGFSYGTLLGATYAELYPENVGRLVLDGAVDPGLSGDDLVLGQAKGFEDSLRAYVADCQAGADCPLQGDADDGLQQIGELLEKVSSAPLPTGADRDADQIIVFYGIARALYNQGSWAVLTQAFDEALRQGTGAVFLALAYDYLGRTESGEYRDNSMIAFTAINCLDYPDERRDHDETVAFLEEVLDVAPTLGNAFAAGVGCQEWDAQAPPRPTVTSAEGAEPILVIGTTGDPATPYEWSVSLADQLDSGVLLTYRGEGHTAALRGEPCVDDVVTAYLVDGNVPSEERTC